MSGFQRMIAIPQEEYIQLKSVQHVKQPESQKMVDLTQLYQQQSQIQDPYEKLMMQGATLDAMKDLKERMRHNLSLGTPKPYRNRALSLYRSIEPHVKFTERGEIYGEDDKPIEHSRAEDLIQHAVRDRRRDFTPVAWDHFVKLLKKHNVPKTVLNRQTIDELENRPVKKHIWKPLNFSSPAVLMPTPHKKTRIQALSSSEKKLRGTKTKLRRSSRIRTPSLRYPAKDFLKYF